MAEVETEAAGRAAVGWEEEVRVADVADVRAAARAAGRAAARAAAMRAVSRAATRAEMWAAETVRGGLIHCPCRLRPQTVATWARM